MTAPIKILLLDSPAANASAVLEALSSHPGQSYDIQWVKTEASVLEAISDPSLDICLFHDEENGNAGITFMQKLEEAKCHLPVIILAKHHVHETDLLAATMGAHDYLSEKAITDGTLERSIRYGVAKHQREAAASREYERRKMESLGRFAGGVAHELNNLLQPIILISETLHSDLKPDAHVGKEKVNTIRESAKFAATIVDELLVYSRHEEGAQSRTDFLSAYQRSIQEVSQHLPENITLSANEEIPLPDTSVDINSRDLYYLLDNLVQNSVHAMGNTGSIHIQPGMEHVEQEKVSFAFKINKGHYATITIKDSGQGMPPKVLQQVFKPFFSTKPQGLGTGLGLPIIHGIIQKWQGLIDISSTVGTGTTVKIYIPANLEKVSPAAQTLPEETKKSGAL